MHKFEKVGINMQHLLHFIGYDDDDSRLWQPLASEPSVFGQGVENLDLANNA